MLIEATGDSPLLNNVQKGHGFKGCHVFGFVCIELHWRLFQGVLLKSDKELNILLCNAICPYY